MGSEGCYYNSCKYHVNQEFIILNTAVGQPRKEGNRCTKYNVLCVFVDAPKYSRRSLRPYRLCSFVILIRGPLYGADTPKQDAFYCEFYWAVNFAVRNTVTIPY